MQCKRAARKQCERGPALTHERPRRLRRMQQQGYKRPRSDETLLEFELEIPREVQQHITVIIGPGGATIRWISKETNVKLIQISNANQTNANGSRMCLIKGSTPESLQAAAQIVSSILYDENERERFKHAQRQGMGGVTLSTTPDHVGSDSPQASQAMQSQAMQAMQAQAMQAHAQAAASLLPNLTMQPPQMDVNSLWLAMTQGFEAVRATSAALAARTRSRERRRPRGKQRPGMITALLQVMANLNHLNERLTALEGKVAAQQVAAGTVLSTPLVSVLPTPPPTSLPGAE